ncbi:GHMP kinase [Methanocalculus sp.]|uniref:GHMP family kinase ATP-binding protein n=1 Tax=Methanocalculus sp. TaxID=2004547 RepID=UPI0027245925|nr:GHMP kinase [Methanocalculus sp.]MDO8842146.1 GHMP kinase [Methanocalculus sp.]
MPSSVKAFSPGHISGYFSRITKPTTGETGSIGAGIVLKEGVIASVTRSAETTVTVIADGVRTFGSPPLEEALRRLSVTAAVQSESNLPIGSGFGLSAASLLATITAADALFSLSMSGDEIALLAHEIEVLHGNGLGDVAAELGGGLVCRTFPGIRGVISRNMDFQGPISIISLGPISTRDVIGSAESMERVQSAYPGCCPSDMDDFIRLSRRFAESSGLITPVIRKILSACDEAMVPASMTMLGEGVFATGDRAAALLSRFGRVYTTTIAGDGAGIVEVTP